MSNRFTIKIIDVNDNFKKAYKLKYILSSLEKKRLQRFRFKRDYNCFLVSHVFLRLELAQLLETTPETIEYKYLKFNKPVLKNCSGPHFNLSHVYTKILIGIANKPIGVDIEQITPLYNYKSISNMVFSKNEIVSIEKAKEPLRKFYYFWTKKESLVKATGEGLHDHLTKIDLADRSIIKLNDFSKVRLHCLPISDEYIAHVAILEVQKLNRNFYT